MKYVVKLLVVETKIADDCRISLGTLGVFEVSYDGNSQCQHYKAYMFMWKLHISGPVEFLVNMPMENDQCWFEC